MILCRERGGWRRIPAGPGADGGGGDPGDSLHLRGHQCIASVGAGGGGFGNGWMDVSGRKGCELKSVTELSLFFSGMIGRFPRQE